MGNPATGPRPSLLQYIPYCYGRRLPDTMRMWVAEDLAGEGAARRIHRHQQLAINGGFVNLVKRRICYV
jgi:hypothetical protein